MGKIVSKAMNSEKYDFKWAKKFDILDRDKAPGRPVYFYPEPVHS